jgi:hypothetical protein
MADFKEIERGGNDNLSTFSMIAGIVGWVFFLLLLCSNFLIFPLILATFGLGVLLYICMVPLGCLPPIAWISAVVSGHMANAKIKSEGGGNAGMAKAGLIMGYIGIGLVLVTACVFVVLILAGVSIPWTDLFNLDYVN